MNPILSSQEENDQEDDEKVTLGTKIKVVIAILIVGFAGYVAYWVQKPTDLKVDLLDSSADIAAEIDGVVQEISIIDFAFAPASLKVEKGDAVIWTNMDSVEHTVTADTFTSGPLASGESYTYTFEEEGEYEYFCSFHPQMKGTINVGAAIAETTDLDDQPAEETTLSPAASESPDEEVISLDPFAEDTESLDADETLLNEEVESLDTDETLLNEEVELSNTNESLFNDETKMVRLDAQEFLNSNDAEKSAESSGSTEVTIRSEGSRGAANESTVNAVESKNLSDTGPEDFLYAGLLLVILYFNRRRLRIFRSN
jgi:plastocyanin